MSKPSRPAARATTSQRSGAELPKSDSGAVRSTGSGFQEGAPPTAVEKSRWTISRPQTIQPHGSVVGADGIRSDAAASATQAAAASRPVFLTSWPKNGRLPDDLTDGGHHRLDLRLRELREEGKGQ